METTCAGFLVSYMPLKPKTAVLLSGYSVHTSHVCTDLKHIRRLQLSYVAVHPSVWLKLLVAAVGGNLSFALLLS